MKRVIANITFKDKQSNDLIRKKGEIFDVEDDRAWQLTQTKYKDNTFFCDYYELPWNDIKGKRILIYNYDLYKIGGTETFLLNFCKYYKNKNIIVMYRTGKPDYINMLHDYCEVVRDDGIKKYDCDVLIMGTFFAYEINARVNAKHRYQMIHSDYSGMKKSGWNVKYTQLKDTIPIAVSDIAANGLKTEFGYDSLVIYNILDKDLAKENPLIFITLSRATKEKGIYRIIELSKLFKRYNKKFLWLLCGSVAEQSDNELKKKISEIQEIILIPPNANNKILIKASDYLVQLSDTESFCYSAYESLIMGKPILLTDFPGVENIIKEGENGYIIPRDVNKYDKKLVDKIFNKVPKNITYEDRCNYKLWEDILSGKDIKLKR